MYLSPDGQYLTPTLYDLRISPLEEEKRQQALVLHQLLADQSPSKGPSSAPVTLVVFSDFQCPYCRRFADYVDAISPDPKNSVRIVYKYFPLTIHPWAEDAARLASCVAAQDEGAFWTVHDFVFQQQQVLNRENLHDRVRDLLAAHQPNIDVTRVDQCIGAGSTVNTIKRDEALGKSLNVHGTPTAFINGARIPGVRNAGELRLLVTAIANGRSVQEAIEQGKSESAPADHGNACAPQGRDLRSVSSGK